MIGNPTAEIEVQAADSVDINLGAYTKGHTWKPLDSLRWKNEVWRKWSMGRICRSLGRYGLRRDYSKNDVHHD